MSESVMVVSGLPRSGTSMMMSMLNAGGIDLLVDDHRPGDESNLGGYFEFGPVLASRDSVDWVSQAEGKAVKVIYALLDVLPPEFEYRVIFLLRSLSDVVESQSRMLERRGQTGAGVPQPQLIEIFAKERERSLQWIRQQENFSLTTVSYESILENPMNNSRQIANFLGRDLDLEAMVEAVVPGLRTVR